MRFIIPIIFLASIACAETRYRQSIGPKGEITYAPLPAEDVTGDGTVNMADVIAVKAAIPVTSQPTPPPVIIPPPVTTQPAPGDRVLGPLDSWQLAVDSAKPGDTIWFAGGEYRDRTVPDKVMLYSACLAINVSGEPGKPITLRNLPGETPVFFGNHPLIWAIRIGLVKYNGSWTPVHDIVIDGLHATQAPWDGIEISHSWNITVRNCWAFANNFNSPNGYKAGINIDAGHDITIDHCRIFDNGFGICGYEDQPDGHEWPNPSGPYAVSITNNFIFGNSRSGNLGNSPGMDIRFATRCTYTGNIFYDNPDAGINGEGNVLCKIVGNICINQWQEPGNREGGKVCVRGGGGNVIAGNLFVGNGNCGWDATSGVGDLLLNNTFTDNGSWGVLAEGWETVMFNNIIAANSVRVQNAYPNLAAPGWSVISDWNLFGPGPIYGPNDDTLRVLPPNTQQKTVEFDTFPMRRNEVRQIVPPEQAFGCSTIEEARARIRATYVPSVVVPGTTLADVQQKCDRNIPAVQAAADQAIAKAATSPDFQMKQATFRWQELKRLLTSYDLSGLPDNRVMGASK